MPNGGSVEVMVMMVRSVDKQNKDLHFAYSMAGRFLRWRHARRLEAWWCGSDLS
jgi:hypothetical protein